MQRHLRNGLSLFALLFLVSCGKEEPKTVPYNNDMWRDWTEKEKRTPHPEIHKDLRDAFSQSPSKKPDKGEKPTPQDADKLLSGKPLKPGE